MPASSLIRRIARTAKRVAAGLVALVALMLIVGASTEAIARNRAARRFQPSGRLVDIGGRRIHIDCRGNGSPAVVLESGLDLLGSLSWAAVHDSIAKTTRVCAYSRAGIMWSDPSPLPFSSANVARDLRAALTNAGESAPFVMVGHSIGGPYVAAFTAMYGDQVAGVVLVDASHPDQVARMEKATGASMTPSTGLFAFGVAMARTGLTRLVAGDVAPTRAPRVVHEASAAYAAISLAAALRETEAIPATFASARFTRALGSRPLVVLTAMAPLTPAEREVRHLNIAQEANLRAAWKLLQADEATWSTRGRQVLVPDAEHSIQFDRPDVVIDAVREVVCAVRRDRNTPCSAANPES